MVLLATVRGAMSSPSSLAPVTLTLSASSAPIPTVTLRGISWLDDTPASLRLAAVGDDGSIRVFTGDSTTTLTEARSITRRNGNFRALAVTDGSKGKLATGDDAGVIRTWDLPAAAELKKSATRSGLLARNNDRDRAVVEYEGVFSLFDLDDPGSATPLADTGLDLDKTKPMRALALRKKRAAALDANGRIGVWDAGATPSVLGAIESGSAAAIALEAKNDPAQLLFSGGSNGSISQWRLPTNPPDGWTVSSGIAALDLKDKQAAAFDSAMNITWTAAPTVTARAAITPPGGGVASIAVDRKGGKIAIASDEPMSTLTALDLAGGATVIAKFGKKAKSLAMTNGLVFGLLDTGGVEVIDIKAPTPAPKAIGGLSGATSLGVDGDSTHVLIGKSDGTIAEAKGSGFASVGTVLNLGSGPITAVCSIPNAGSGLAFAFSDGNSVNVCTDTDIVQKFTGLSGPVRELAVSSSESDVIYARLDDKIVPLRILFARSIRALDMGETAGVTALDALATSGSSPKTRFFAGRSDGKVAVIEEDGTLTKVLDDLAATSTPIRSVIAQDKWLVAATEDAVGLWVTESGSLAFKGDCNLHLGAGVKISGLEALADNGVARPSAVAVTAGDGSIVVIDTSDSVDLDDPPTLTLGPDATKSAARGIVLTPQGTLVASRINGIVETWPQIIRSDETPASTDSITGLVDDGEGDLYASSRDGTVRSPGVTKALLTSPSPLRALATAKVGSARVIAAGGDEKSISLIDDAGGLLATQTKAHPQRITALAFNSDATRLVSASSDAVLKVWDVKPAPLSLTLLGAGDQPPNTIAQIPAAEIAAPRLAYDPKVDPNRVAVAVGSRLILFKDSAGEIGRAELTVGTAPEFITDVAWSPGAKFLAVTTNLGRVYVYDAP